MTVFRSFRYGSRKPMTDKEKKEAQAKIEKLQAEDSKISKIRFINHKSKGGLLEFTFKKYKEDPYIDYKLKDGETYDLPMAVINHINNDCIEPLREYEKDAYGKTLLTTKVVGHDRKYECVPVNFM